MKTSRVIVLVVLGYLAGMSFGAFVESVWHYLEPVSESGSPKNEIPQPGSVLHVESSFDDGTFVASYAGKRLFYKAPASVNKTRIILEAGRAYEVVDQKIQNGGRQKVLVLVTK